MSVMIENKRSPNAGQQPIRHAPGVVNIAGEFGLQGAISSAVRTIIRSADSAPGSSAQTEPSKIGVASSKPIAPT